MEIPSDLKYSKTDEWVKMEGNVAVLGITDYARSNYPMSYLLRFLTRWGIPLPKDLNAQQSNR